VAKKNTHQLTSALKIVFWLLMGTFGFIVSMFAVPIIREAIRGPLFLVPFIFFTLLAIILLFLTIKQKVRGRLKKLLLIVGFSAVGIFVGIVLHNLLYALAEIITRPPLLHTLLEALHIVFFFVAIIIAPLGFIIAAFLTLRLFITK
jgi:hypothetical protein